MLSLAVMVWSSYMYLQSAVNMRSSVPPPIVIEKEIDTYSYSKIESAIYVPEPWQATCDEQQLLVLMMAEHFNNFRNMDRKINYKILDQIASKWKCLE